MKTDARRLRHASVPVMYDWQRRGSLRKALLEHYDDDDDFRRDLRTLALPGGDDRGRVAEFAERYGLDRLIADEHNDDGIALLCDWVYWSRQSPGRDLKLCDAAGFGGAVAELAVEDRIAWDADEMTGRLADAGIPTTPHVRSGDPAAEILDDAQDRRADLIVTGSRGLGGLESLLLGSVARNVLIHAHCSVLIVRTGAAVASSQKEN